MEVSKRYIMYIYTHDTDMYILVGGVDRCALVTHNNMFTEEYCSSEYVFFILHAQEGTCRYAFLGFELRPSFSATLVSLG